MGQVAERIVRPAVDEDGLLIDPNSWTRTLAQEIADELGIGTLTERHWKFIGALRAHYAQFGVAPAMNRICQKLSEDRHSVHDLFHSCLNAWRVAGLPNPGEEAKSYMSAG